MIKRSFSALAIIILFLFTQCHKAQTVGLFTQNDLSALNVLNTDTFSVVTSTVALDSVPTFEVGNFNDSTILVGRTADPYLGIVTAKSFFQLSPPKSGGSPWNLTGLQTNNQIRFDSIVLDLKYNSSNIRYEDFGLFTKKQANTNNSYYQTYGDTAQSMTLQLFYLNKPLVKNQVLNTQFTGGLTAPYFYNTLVSGTNPQALFNTASGSYNPDSVYASVNFTPHSRSQPDSVVIRLPDTLGKTLINFAYFQDSRISTDQNFINYFNGFALAVKPNTRGSIVSFNPRTSLVKIYYKKVINGTFINQIENVSLNYGGNNPPIISNTFFNQILVDRTGTPLAGIKPYTPLPVSKTGNTTYIESGSGLMTKVEFPYLQSFFNSHQNLVVNRAELIVQNKPGTYAPGFRLPPFLQLYVNNQSNLNVPIGILSQDFVPSSPNAVERTYIGNIAFGYYHFYITQYFGSQVYKPFYDGTALFLGNPAKSIENSADRMLINNPLIDKNSIKLRVFFTQTNANTN